MKSSTIVSLLALAISLVALVAMLRGSPTAGSRELAPALPAVAGPEEGLLARMEALAEENRDLRDRLAMLELRPAAQRTPVTDAFASREEFDTFREEVREALAGRKALRVESPALKEQVASTLSEIRKGEAVQKAREGLEKRAAAIDEIAPKITNWLQLTPDQTDSMRAALLTRYEREAEYIRLWEEGADEEIIGELKASDRETHRTELSGFLTPRQLEMFWNRGGGK